MRVLQLLLNHWASHLYRLIFIGQPCQFIDALHLLQYKRKEVNKMALSLININVNVSGNSTRFFNVLAAPLAVVDGTTVAVATFLDDSGTAATAFPVLTNGYYNLYINGVLQEGDSYTISATVLTFNDVTGTISAGTPLIVEAVELVTVI